MKLSPASNVNFTAKNTVRAEYTEIQQDGSTATISKTYDKATGKLVAYKKTLSADTFEGGKEYKDGSYILYSQDGGSLGVKGKINGSSFHVTITNNNMLTRKELAKLLSPQASEESFNRSLNPDQAMARLRSLQA